MSANVQAKAPLPPSRFRPAANIDRVEHSATPPPFLRTRKRKGRKAEGIRYENKAQDMLLERFPDNYVPGPWFRFLEYGQSKWRWCQPDGLLIDFHYGRITVVEIKLQHTSDAWWQVKWLYLPVLYRAFDPQIWEFTWLEVVKWYDCSVNFPERVSLCPDVLSVEPGQFGVYIWKPGR